MRVRRVARGLPVAALAAALAGGSAAAQSSQPIYPVYDGFHVTDDGVYVISYAYFSHNFDEVTVPPGDANAFGTEPADRLQPTTFRPGHHRFQCVMVMGTDFTGGLRWTLSHAGTTTSTSEDMLQYNWELDDRTRGAVLREVDLETAPHGVCLNRSPLVRFLGLRRGPEGEPPEVEVAAGAELKLFGSVRDEGLPRSGRLTSAWRVLGGPGEVRFSAPDEPRTLAWFDAPGVYELELRASDSEREAAERLVVRVGAGE